MQPQENSSTVLELTKDLISKASITPEDAGCQSLIANYLQTLGFKVIELPFAEVKNIWATFGTGGPLFVYAGHTDVVPPGPLEKWNSDPFTATIRGDYLFARGIADMKGSIAAMLVACKEFLSQRSKITGQLGILITGDEEGTAENGTKKVVEYLRQQNISIDHCLIGEPSSEIQLGDTIKVGRRGSLSGKLTIHGKQGHIAYPMLADNPIHRGVRILNELVLHQWDQGNEYFQPTQFQISNIHAGTGTGNMTPDDLLIDFNFRYSPIQSHTALQNFIINLLESHQIKYSIEWRHSGKPFMSQPGMLAKSLRASISSTVDREPKFSTSGGTSDGRFLIDISKELLEFGLCNQSIHKIDEHIYLPDLENLKNIYKSLLESLL